MRLILRLEALIEQAYDNNYNHYVQSFLYNLIKNSEFSQLHDFKGTSSSKQAITPFCFSNLFPYGDMKIGDIKSIIITSPNEKFISLLYDTIRRINSPIHLGGMQFHVMSLKIFRLYLSFPLVVTSVTPRQKAQSISSEMDYIRLTIEFYDHSWQASEEAEERFETIWTIVRYIYRADLSEDHMIKLLRTRSGLLTINSYSRTHLEGILSLDRAISSATDIEKKLDLQSQIRMYSINVPVTDSVKFTHRSGTDDRQYMIVEADYDPTLGLLTDL